jgi:hypothetical protein
MRPVVAPSPVGAGTAGDLADPGRPAELAHGDHQRFIQESALE